MIAINYLRLVIFSLILTACASTPTLRGNQSYPFAEGNISVLDESGQCYMSLQGKITASMNKSFNLALQDINQRPCKEKILILTSHGGDMDAAIEMGIQIRQARFITDMHEYCESACAFLYIAGTKRLVHPSSNRGQECRLGVHQPTNEVILCQCIDLTDGHPLVIQKIKNYFSRMLPKKSWEALYREIFATSCKQISYLDAQFLLQNGIATDLASSKYR